MKVGILAGGFGTRLAEETEIRPKPMVEIGGRPILWHIMSHYARYHHSEFVIALGYKGEYIKRWFNDFCTLSGNMTVETGSGAVTRHEGEPTSWTVDLIETGLKTGTGGRIRKMAPWLAKSTFMLTYGDGVSNVDVDTLVDFHRSHGKLATMTAVRPPARYGHIEFQGDRVVEFSEKSQTGEGWINGGFFILEPGVLDFIHADNEMFEHAAMNRLAEAGELMAYRHQSFWQCMDTLREKHVLERLWEDGQAPWKTWD
jgi:glucose-1-phosphate cytidylyltransferase